MADIVRVLRVLEYVGPREAVEEQVRKSIHGERRGIGGIVIRAATLGEYPEVISGEYDPEKITKLPFPGNPDAPTPPQYLFGR